MLHVHNSFGRSCLGTLSMCYPSIVVHSIWSYSISIYLYIHRLVQHGVHMCRANNTWRYISDGLLPGLLGPGAYHINTC